MRPTARLLTTLAALALGPACATPQAALQASATVTEEPNPPAPEAPAGLLRPLETGEGFTVQMPAAPQEQRNTVKLPAGEVRTVAWSQTVDGVLYSVSLADYPAHLVASTKPEVFLEEGKTGLVQQVKGTLKEEQAVSLGEHPGKAFTVASDAGEVKARNYLVGRRLYTLLVLYNPAIGAPEADAFLASLALLPAATAAGQP